MNKTNGTLGRGQPRGTTQVVVQVPQGRGRGDMEGEPKIQVRGHWKLCKLVIFSLTWEPFSVNKTVFQICNV